MKLFLALLGFLFVYFIIFAAPFMEEWQAKNSQKTQAPLKLGDSAGLDLIKEPSSPIMSYG